MATRSELIKETPLIECHETTGLFRIRESDLEQFCGHLFQRYPEREWGSFFRFGFRRTSRGIALSFVSPLLPEPGDLDRQSGLTRFDAAYARRAFHAAASDDGLGLGVAHSHPEGCRTSPSLLDNDMDTYFSKQVESYTGGRPYASLIFSSNAKGELSFSGRVYDRGSWFGVRDLVTVGDRVRRIRSQLVSDTNKHGTGETAITNGRLRSLMGDASAARLADATVGVIGCSGTGSPAVEVLARAGVGSFVLVDPERLSVSNLERLHGSHFEHLRLDPKPYKVELMRSMIRRINPAAHVVSLVGNVLHENVIDRLVYADIVLGCTDSMHGRVALDELARNYLVASIDVGVRMGGRCGRIDEQVIEHALYGPTHPCLFCRKKVDAQRLAYELMPDTERHEREAQAEAARECGIDGDQYWQGRPRELHTVGYLTTVAGAMAAGYAEGVLTGTFSPPHPEHQFDFATPRFGVVSPPLKARESCGCLARMGWGDAARPHTNLAAPPHFGRRAVELGE